MLAYLVPLLVILQCGRLRGETVDAVEAIAVTVTELGAGEFLSTSSTAAAVEPGKLAVYVPATNLVRINRDAFTRAVASRCMSAAELDEAKKILLYHEKVHAWQGRSCNLAEEGAKPGDEDQALVRRAILEGHAEWKTELYCRQQGWAELQRRVFEESADPLTAFLYGGGKRYFEGVYKASGGTVGEATVLAGLLARKPTVLEVALGKPRDGAAEAAHTTELDHIMAGHVSKVEAHKLPTLAMLTILGYPQCDRKCLADYVGGMQWTKPDDVRRDRPVTLVEFASERAAKVYFECLRKRQREIERLGKMASLPLRTTASTDVQFDQESVDAHGKVSSTLTCLLSGRQIVTITNIAAWGMQVEEWKGWQNGSH